MDALPEKFSKHRPSPESQTLVVGIQHTKGWFYYDSPVLFQVHWLSLPPPPIFTMKKPAWEAPWIKHSHEEVSLGTKPKDQGWELSLHSLEGVQNRYLSGKRTAGGYCFVGEWSAIWKGFSTVRPHSDSAGCCGKFGLQRKGPSPVCVWAAVDVKLITWYGVYAWPLAGNARGYFKDRSLLGNWPRAVTVSRAINQIGVKKIAPRWWAGSLSPARCLAHLGSCRSCPGQKQVHLEP